MPTIGVTGHQGIPNAALRFIEAKLSEALSSHHENLTGVSSLAAGADQMFAEAVLRHGGRLHVIVPCRRYEASFNENASLADYRRFVQRADRVETLDYPAPSETAFLAAGKRVVDNCQILLAIWDGERSRGQGGTAEVVEYARLRRCRVVVIWPAGVTR